MTGVNLDYDLMEVGSEKSPLIVIDNFWPEPAALKEIACASGNFNEMGRGMYPGIRSPLPSSYINNTFSALSSIIKACFHVPDNCQKVTKTGYFSLLSTPEKELSVLQSIPHFDSSRPYQFALLHYLGEGDFNGTGIFRHRPTGFENITEPRVNRFIESCKEFWKENGYPSPGYARQSDRHFELIDKIPYQCNRLLIYSTNLLHSALAEPGADINNNPVTGRLTANMFVDFDG